MPVFGQPTAQVDLVAPLDALDDFAQERILGDEVIVRDVGLGELPARLRARPGVEAGEVPAPEFDLPEGTGFQVLPPDNTEVLDVEVILPHLVRVIEERPGIVRGDDHPPELIAKLRIDRVGKALLGHIKGRGDISRLLDRFLKDFGSELALPRPAVS
ncbi:MAG TPA: hypothetical protein DIW61_08490 [Candidatus Aminicenantes bacterium]|nr:hypothetical protein [Candidatus Aminicenantes bacterium]